MHLTTLTTTLLLSLSATPFATAKTDYQYAVACAGKSPATNAAISAFCNKRGPAGKLTDTIMVPGPRSSKGVVTQGVRVKITGNCNPAQWVPREYCGLQFHMMCANAGSGKGYNTKWFGRGGCQKWVIESANAAGEAVLAGLHGRDAEKGGEGGEEGEERLVVEEEEEVPAKEI